MRNCVFWWWRQSLESRRSFVYGRLSITDREPLLQLWHRPRQRYWRS